MPGRDPSTPTAVAAATASSRTAGRSIIAHVRLQLVQENSGQDQVVQGHSLSRGQGIPQKCPDAMVLNTAAVAQVGSDCSQAHVKVPLKIPAIFGMVISVTGQGGRGSE